MLLLGMFNDSTTRRYKKKTMAKDDMHLIVYKILRYLYGCNKEGKVPTFTDMLKALELPAAPVSYIRQIIDELLKNGYIDGINIIETKDGSYIDVSERAMITIRGVDYLHDNGRLGKAASMAGKAFEILVEAIISAAMPLGR